MAGEGALMGTFIYSPEARVHIQTSRRGIIDISDDIVRGSVNRVINGPSSATLTFRNPRRKYDGIFAPNDTIVIRLKRIAWMPVFTGYLNVVPLTSAFQRSVTLTASCSLKKLQMWPWDEGAAESVALILSAGGAAAGNPADIDGGFRGLTEAILDKVVGWGKDKVHIGALPPEWLARAENVYAQMQSELQLPPSFALGAQSSLYGAGAPSGTGIMGKTELEGRVIPRSSGVAKVQPIISVSSMAAYATEFRVHLPFPGTVDLGFSSSNDDTAWWHGRRVVLQNPSTQQHCVCVVANRSTDVTAAAIVAPAVRDALAGSGSDLPVYLAFYDGPKGPGPLSAADLVASSGQSQQDLSSVNRGDAWTFPLPTGQYNVGYGPHHDGDMSKLDIGAASGTAVLAPFSGTVSQVGNTSSDSAGGNSIIITGDNGWAIYMCHFVEPASVSVGQKVNSGQQVGKVGSTGRSTGPHLHLQTTSGGRPWAELFTRGARYTPILALIKELESKGTISAAPGQGAVAADGTGSLGASIRKLINNYDWTGTEASDDSIMLAGPRALMNDSAILPYIATLMRTSQRDFCSGPNGDFCAWFPDYFGNYKALGVLNVSEIELQDFTIEWDDAPLVTHQFVTGSSDQGSSGRGGVIDENAKFSTMGIASVDFPPLLRFLFNLSDNEQMPDVFSSMEAILDRFGARVSNVQMPLVISRAGEFWHALNLFQKAWSSQFIARVPLTFMPEAWPGMLLRLPPSIGFQAYITGVNHSFDFQSGGFTTSVQISAPSTYNGQIWGLPRSGPGAKLLGADGVD